MLTLFRIGFLGAAHFLSPLPLNKIRHTYPTMMKLGTIMPYLREIQKCINHVTHQLSSADISIFSRKSANFATSRNTDIDWILIHNF